MRPLYEAREDLFHCPDEPLFTAQGRDPLSYALNAWLHDPWEERPRQTPVRRRPLFWHNAHLARGPGAVPVLLDAIGGEHVAPYACDEPPPHANGVVSYTSMVCIPRHGRFVNGVFMDWSVRPVGLKQLWTLKWHRAYDTSGPWTKAGGVLPEDWPGWMRGFRDY